jgi:hypothetical protein
MTGTSAGAGAEGRLDWLLVDFRNNTPGVRNAVVVSGDGLCVATTQGMGQTLGDQLSAAASGLISLARGAARLLDGGAVAQLILEMADGYLFVTSISTGATLAVHADRRCDIGMVGYEMTMLATRVGHALTPSARAEEGRRR